MSNMGLKTAIFNKNAIKYPKWPLLTAYNSWINYWESSKLTDSKINPSRENHAYFIPCKPPHKTHPREYFGTTLWFIQIATSVVEKSQILSAVFHLSTTVGLLSHLTLSIDRCQKRRYIPCPHSATYTHLHLILLIETIRVHSIEYKMLWLSYPIPATLFMLHLRLVLPRDLTLSTIWTHLDAIWWWEDSASDIISANWHAEDLSRNQVEGGESVMMTVEGIPCRNIANDENSSSVVLKIM